MSKYMTKQYQAWIMNIGPAKTLSLIDCKPKAAFCRNINVQRNIAFILYMW